MQTSVTGWLEAFAAHPKIGDLDSLRKKFGAFAAHSSEEQKHAATGAGDETLKVAGDKPFFVGDEGSAMKCMPVSMQYEVWLLLETANHAERSHTSDECSSFSRICRRVVLGT